MTCEKDLGWKSWEDIKKWAEKNGFKNLAKRMQLNNDCWMSCGEFGRDQTYICDSLRFAKDENEAIEIASQLDCDDGSEYGELKDLGIV